nr:HTH domain-containing protein [Candidatus Nitrosarchaeum limnium]
MYKKEQEDRRQKVYNMYFEKGFSAIKIASELEVNRNTINQDIKFLRSDITKKDQIKPAIWLLEQKEHLEQQKDRLIELLETTKEFEQRLRVERIILDIENKIINLVIKMTDFNSVAYEYDPGPEFDEDVTLIVKDLVLNGKTEKDLFLQNEIILKARELFKCDYTHAKKIFSRMNDFGLKEFVNEDGKGYDLARFGILNQIITETELDKRNKAHRQSNKVEPYWNKIGKNFIDKDK